jgi:hypothetical protein
MEVNNPVYAYYQPGYVHPMFYPYVYDPIKDNNGNLTMVNRWKVQGSPSFVNPELVRKGWGMAFANKFEDDPCPPGFIKGEGGYCFPRKPDNEPVFYTDKAFIPKRQFWDSYTESAYGKNGDPKIRRVSESFDMRSINPLNGRYDVSYLPVVQNKRHETQYGLNPTKDSYLG